MLQSVTECYRVLESVSASTWTNFWACLEKIRPLSSELSLKRTVKICYRPLKMKFWSCSSQVEKLIVSVIIVKLPITREISETVHLGPEKVWKGSNKKAVFYSPMSKSVPLEVNEAYEPLQQSFYQSRLLLPHFTPIIIRGSVRSGSGLSPEWRNNS